MLQVPAAESRSPSARSSVVDDHHHAPSLRVSQCYHHGHHNAGRSQSRRNNQVQPVDNYRDVPNRRRDQYTGPYEREFSEPESDVEQRLLPLVLQDQISRFIRDCILNIRDGLCDIWNYEVDSICATCACLAFGPIKIFRWTASTIVISFVTYHYRREVQVQLNNLGVAVINQRDRLWGGV